LNSNHAYFAANTPTSNEFPLKRISASLFPRFAFLSCIYLCCVNEFHVLCPASGRFSYPCARSAVHGIKKQHRGRLSFFLFEHWAVDRRPAFPSRPGRGRYRGVVFQAVALPRYGLRGVHRRAQPPFPTPFPTISLSAFLTLVSRCAQCLVLSALARFICLAPARGWTATIDGGTRRNPFERRRPPGCLLFRRRRTCSNTNRRTHTNRQYTMNTNTHDIALDEGTKEKRTEVEMAKAREKEMQTNTIGFIIHFPSRRDLPLFASSPPFQFPNIIPSSYQWSTELQSTW